MATALERLEAQGPFTKSSTSAIVVSSTLANDLLAELPDGADKDALESVTPPVKSSTANARFSSALAGRIVAELTA